MENFALVQRLMVTFPISFGEIFAPPLPIVLVPISREAHGKFNAQKPLQRSYVEFIGAFIL
jgi:hypothetical protein